MEIDVTLEMLIDMEVSYRATPSHHPCCPRSWDFFGFVTSKQPFWENPESSMTNEATFTGPPVFLGSLTGAGAAISPAAGGATTGATATCSASDTVMAWRTRRG